MPIVSSSAIRSVSYDAVRRQLHIRFREGRAYTYFEVPPEEYDALMAAPSKGAYVNHVIKARYRFAPSGR